MIIMREEVFFFGTKTNTFFWRFERLLSIERKKCLFCELKKNPPLFLCVCVMCVREKKREKKRPPLVIDTNATKK